jgi:DNA-binding transcriptional MerR regulator
VIRHSYYKIGELAQLSGISVKTLRFYSDLGVLPPSQITESGHRMYSDLDHAKLEAIRSLRSVGVSLESIAQVMQHEDSISEALRLQLETVELELCQLQRHKTVLRAAIQRNDSMTYLRSARVLAGLSAGERRGFLAKRIQQMLDGVPADQTWVENVWGGPLLELPETLSDAQFEAWLELAELIADQDFIANSNRTGRAFWGQFQSNSARDRFMRENQALEVQCSNALNSGTTPESDAGQGIIKTHLAIHARAVGKRVSPSFARAQLKQIAQNTDPRATRFWELIAVLRGWHERNTFFLALHAWRVRGLEVFLEMGGGIALKGRANRED